MVGRRKRGQAARAFGRWANTNEYEVFMWWKSVPLATETMRPQETATEQDYVKVVCSTLTLRDKAVVEVLSLSGELAVEEFRRSWG